MKKFNDFKEIMNNNYKEFHETVICKTNIYLENHPDLSDEGRLMAYSEICSMEMLSRYHEWLNH